MLSIFLNFMVFPSSSRRFLPAIFAKQPFFPPIRILSDGQTLKNGWTRAHEWSRGDGQTAAFNFEPFATKDAIFMPNYYSASCQASEQHTRSPKPATAHSHFSLHLHLRIERKAVALVCGGRWW